MNEGEKKGWKVKEKSKGEGEWMKELKKQWLNEQMIEWMNEKWTTRQRYLQSEQMNAQITT